MEEENNKHPRQVVGYDGSLKELAQAVGHMSYDQVVVFIEEFSSDIKAQADADLTIRGRKKLFQELSEVAKHLDKAKTKMDSVWGICEPYMQNHQNLTKRA